jgi:hypothetical protein
MKSVRDAKDIYDAIEVPQELDETVRVAARSASRKPRPVRRHAVRYTACAAAACMVLFVTALNTIPAFASGLSEIPVIGRLAQVLTFAEYEAKQLYLENGGKEDEYMIPEINIDYRLHCNNGSAVSFVLIKSETHASYYEEQYYYNIDLETGKELSLRDLLGPNYKELVRQLVRQQIEERREKDPDAYFYSEEELALFGMTLDDPGFYLNEQGNVVVVYPKYEIAPGYMGIQEFEITQ